MSKIKTVISRIYVHPQYTITSENELYNDIAIITLQNRISINQYINPVCLPEHQLFGTLTATDKLTLSGFGLFINPDTYQWEKPTFLQVTDKIRKLPVEDCIGNPHENTLGYFCAGDGKSFEEISNFTPDSCQGDSGKKERKWSVIVKYFVVHTASLFRAFKGRKLECMRRANIKAQMEHKRIEIGA